MLPAMVISVFPIMKIDLTDVDLRLVFVGPPSPCRMFSTLFLDVSQNTPINYLPVAIQALVAVGFVVLVMASSHLLGPKRKTADKLINFESGIPSVGNARQPMAIKYFLVAILFVLFDVEVIFFYPYAVNFKDFLADGSAPQVFLSVVLFVGFFLCGFIYIIKKGALKWED